MKLGELLAELDCDDDAQLDYKVIIQLQYKHSDIDANLVVTAVQWRHQDGEVILEVDGESDD